LKIHVLGEADIVAHLGSTRDEQFAIPTVSVAYQLIWADKHNQFPDQLVKRQRKLDVLHIKPKQSDAASSAASNKAKNTKTD
ncbi:MAG TPA: hypothetical protein VM260_19895, partial [Pirellula sp.]|nr:hypothetical protein [Pirellula sp.]